MAEPRNNGTKTRGRPFPAGNAGRPKGARHRSTVLAEKLMQDDTREIVEAVIMAAKGGDMTAARLILERIAPLRRGRAVSFDLPATETPADLLTALDGLLRATAAGVLTPDEAATIAGLLETKRKTLETIEIERRLTALENRK